jgi:hypothetical protein
MAGGDDKQRIRERAYELWEGEGRPNGRHVDHWVQAEREVAGRRGAEGAGRSVGDAGPFGEGPGAQGRGGSQPSGGAERGFDAAGGTENLEGMRRQGGSGQADQAPGARGPGRIAAGQPQRSTQPGQAEGDKPSRSRGRKGGEELSEAEARRGARRKE